MTMKYLALIIGILFVLLSPQMVMATGILESFTITTHDVEIRKFTETSVQLKTDHSAYVIKLEPNKRGNIVFSLSGIGYSSTAKVSSLWFGVSITGYYNDEIIHPIISLDDINKEIVVDGDMIKFKWINGSLPVVFDRHVDSVKLQFSNSYGMNVNQYLGIEDLRIIPSIKTTTNPQLASCENNNIMIGIDGSSSIDKRERAIIGNQLLNFVKRSELQEDSSTLCILEFGTKVLAVDETAEEKALIRTIKRYKRRKNHETKETSWTNWAAAFDEAIVRKPDIFIFITDGWSNWYGEEPMSFSAQYEQLISKSNTLKANGTRLVFITSGMDNHSSAKSNLFPFLNGNMTMVCHEGLLYGNSSLHDVDLIAIQEFSLLRHVDLTSVLNCPLDITDADQM